ncbi:MAG: NAD-dependent epimerase/dehydratase family protein [Firmicutes bacterium]|nr:NAD-dependent epimerase/dehydratase family protein [Bacillota bacterium]
MGKGRVLVTGGAGFIGSHIVDQLLASGYEPFVVDNLSGGRREHVPAGVPFYEADIRDRDRLAAVFAEVKPDFVSHQAAQVSVVVSMQDPVFDAEVNILGWLRVLEQCARSGVKRVVYASSGGVLYGDVFEPADEIFPIRPVSPYGIAKWAGEKYLEFFAREHGFKGIALRYANVYGPRQDPLGEAGVVAIFTQRLLTGEPVTIFGDGKNVRDYVYVQDVARANLAAIEANLQDDFTALNIGTGIGTDVNSLEVKLRLLTRNEVCRQIRDKGEGLSGSEIRNEGGKSAERSPIIYAEQRPGDLRSSLLFGRSAQRILGWHPGVSIETGLQETVRWFMISGTLDEA